MCVCVHVYCGAIFDIQSVLIAVATFLFGGGGGGDDGRGFNMINPRFDDQQGGNHHIIIMGFNNNLQLVSRRR